MFVGSIDSCGQSHDQVKNGLCVLLLLFSVLKALVKNGAFNFVCFFFLNNLHFNY